MQNEPMEIERAIQFLVCPQRDFIGWLEPGTRPPNRLHVGPGGTEKLRGAPGARDVFVETVRRFYDDARPGTDRLRVVFDEDWHPRRCDEFPVYGEHCVKGTKGAELVGGLEAFRWHPRTFVLRANSVNVAASPRYAEVVEHALGEARVEATRVGIFGVWTHVKVEQLAINLRTLAPAFQHVAICEALCASPERQDHAAAIRKLKQMGFEIFEEVEPYLAWMGLA
jgi:nicotinamidase-related amidase